MLPSSIVHLGMRDPHDAACLRNYAVQQASKMANREEIWHQDLHKVLGKR